MASQTVILAEMKCTCQKWQLYHMPCSHAIAAMKKAKRRTSDYIDKYYTVECYRNIYAPKFSTILDQHYWPAYSGFLFLPDPQRRRKPGRPVTQRLRNEMDWSEQRDADWCRHCQEYGHSTRKCPTKKSSTSTAKAASKRHS
jgi:hypothetical protein